jgi:hypothetical protein
VTYTWELEAIYLKQLTVVDHSLIRRQLRQNRITAAKIKNNPARHGAIAQLGERIVRNDEVVGSIPTSSTIFSSTCSLSIVIPEKRAHEEHKEGVCGVPFIRQVRPPFEPQDTQLDMNTG